MLSDAAVVIRRQYGHVKVKHAVSLVGNGALGGAFWGLLIGLIFWMPWAWIDRRSRLWRAGWQIR